MSGRGRGRGRGRHGDRLSQLFPQSVGRGRSQATSSPSSSSGGIPEMGDLSLASGSSSAASTPDPDGRTFCFITVTGSLAPEFAVAQSITQSFHKYLQVGGYRWSVVSEATRDVYWAEFKKFYYWEDGQEDAIYAKWAKKASIRYSDFMSSMKARRRNGEGPPEYVGVEVWSAWEAYWDTEKAQSLARQARQNRLSEPDGEGTGQIRHRGGSRSASAHAIALAEQSGDPLASSVYATFKRFHVSATGEYTDAKSRRIGEEVERRIALASQPLPDGTLPPPVDANEIYLEVTGGPTKKHRVFGLGSMYSGTPAAHPGSSSQFMAPPAFTEQQIDDRVRERMEAERAQIVSDMETRMQEREDRLRQEMREQMDTLLNTFIHSATRPPGSSS